MKAVFRRTLLFSDSGLFSTLSVPFTSGCFSWGLFLGFFSFLFSFSYSDLFHDIEDDVTVRSCAAEKREKKVICACECVIWGAGGGTRWDRIKGR